MQNNKVIFKGKLTADLLKNIQEKKKSPSKEENIKSSIDIIEKIQKQYTSKEIKINIKKKDEADSNKD